MFKNVVKAKFVNGHTDVKCHTEPVPNKTSLKVISQEIVLDRASTFYSCNNYDNNNGASVIRQVQ
jgi:predicted hotdog family 3-hydroxylacyl-ACP dehydratase